MKRYSAVAVFSQDLERVCLIHKLRPAWQAGKANFPGGKVDDKDVDAKVVQAAIDNHDLRAADSIMSLAHLHCAARELAEETGLTVDAAALKLFCTLRFRRAEDGEDAECRFYAVALPCRGRDLEDHVKTIEEERVFCEWSDTVLYGEGTYFDGSKMVEIPTMSNLPWLVAMARQTLGSTNTDSTPPFTVTEAGR